MNMTIKYLNSLNFTRVLFFPIRYFEANISEFYCIFNRIYRITSEQILI